MNGNAINIWSDTWLPQHDPGYLRASCPVPLHAPTVVAELMDKDHHTWDLSQIRAFISSLDDQAIMAIPISNSALPMNGRYSVKSGYYYLMKHKKNQVVMKASSSHVIDSNVWFRIWNCKRLPKIKIFLWRSVDGFLPTFEIFFKRKLCQSPICPFCKDQPESIEHTLFLCPWAAKVWFASCIAYRPLPQAFTSLDSWNLDLWLCETFNLEEKGWIITHFAFTSWVI
ncbi:PREDICTED: reverse mRNAase [Prunus dulcis]|uniref:PREDICTED: reverse mRNAase n=1 Tax=Prunus dulcis TaxID=3755 RepID=A0A5E4F3D6_PRUDU|nr:PREDICTED: reverse mRNAase [Prunus dulcis]